MFLAISKAKHLVLILLFSYAAICQAIGFGDIKVYSYLSEPLYAEVELTGFADMNTSLLKVNLADAKEFIRAGIDRPYFLNYLSFSFLNYEKRLFIEIHSSKTIQVPYLEFLIELSWPDGNLIKEYTILLDPPKLNEKDADRPKGFGQLAAQSSAANVKLFGAASIEEQINLQKEKQQRQENEASLVGIERDGNRFSDHTLDVSDPLPVPVTTNDAKPTPTPEADSVKYEQQKQNFINQQHAANIKNSNQKSTGMLKNLLAEIDDIKSEIDFGSGAPTDNNQEPIDFSDVIKPSTTSATVPAMIKPNNVNISTPVPMSTPTSPPIPSKGNYLYLGLILSLLLIAAGFAVAIKRGLLTSILSKKSTDTEPSEAPVVATTSVEAVEKNSLDEVLTEIEIDKFKPIEDIDAEHIELASPVNSVTDTIIIPPEPVTPIDPNVLNSDDLTKFEQEFEKINLDELGIPSTELPLDINHTQVEQPTAALEESDLVQGPTPIDPIMVNSELKLSDEGASLLDVEEDDRRSAALIKIDLAKQYIATGDKDSAKDLLREVIDIGNDDEKLEAQILLASLE